MNPRSISCALFIALIASPAWADETITTIKLSVQARAAPRPALKYLLLPELVDMQQGNPVPAYYKCFMEQNHFYFNKEAVDNREKWQNCPLSELPNDLTEYGGVSTRQADHAARLDTCDWQILNKLRTDGAMLLLPDVQQMRMLAAALKVRYRAQAKAGKFDEAIKTHQTMFALARHLIDHPTLIGNLVGMAIANLAIGPFEEMIQQPGCPNLYWALSQLPSPLIDIRKGSQGERFFINAEFNEFLAPANVWGEADVRRVREKARVFDAIIGGNEEDRKEGRKWIDERLKDDKWLTESRRILVGLGLPEASVKKYPPEQVMFQVLLTTFATVHDDNAKWINFPYWVAEAEWHKRAKSNLPDSMVEKLASSLVASFQKVHRGQARLEQRLALLRVVEALRLYAAAHDGKWPKALADVGVPLPVDPFTGKPFIFKLEGDTAIVQGTPPKGEEKTAAYNIRYEVTIRK